MSNRHLCWETLEIYLIIYSISIKYIGSNVITLEKKCSLFIITWISLNGAKDPAFIDSGILKYFSQFRLIKVETGIYLGIQYSEYQ